MRMQVNPRKGAVCRLEDISSYGMRPDIKGILEAQADISNARVKHKDKIEDLLQIE